MTGAELKEVVTSLPSYEGWQAACETVDGWNEPEPEMWTPESGISWTPENVQRLRDNMGVWFDWTYRVKEVIGKPQLALRTEIAQAAGELLLDHRYAMLKVTNYTVNRQAPEVADSQTVDRFKQASGMEILVPPEDIFERAAQIGNTVLSYRQKADTEEGNLPVVELVFVDSETREPNMSWSSLGIITTKSGLLLREPWLGEGVSPYEPVIFCQSAYHENGTVFPRDSRSMEDTMQLPEVNMLLGKVDLRKILLGEEAQAYVDDYLATKASTN